jgi:hypothetical protein
MAFNVKKLVKRVTRRLSSLNTGNYSPRKILDRTYLKEGDVCHLKHLEMSVCLKQSDVQFL